MNPDTLERLIMDDALGALEPDVRELLQAHLAQAPEAANHQAVIQETVCATREQLSSASADTAPNALPDFKALMQPTARTSPRNASWWLFAAAARLFIGLGMGWFLRPTHKPMPQQETVAQQAAPAAKLPFVIQASSATPSFWSTQRLLEQHHER